MNSCLGNNTYEDLSQVINVVVTTVLWRYSATKY